MATNITTACTRGRRGLPTAAALTVFFFGAQALAQTPPAAPAAPAPVTSPAPPATSPAPPPATDARALDAGLPQAVEPLPPVDAPPPPDVAAEPPPPPEPATTPEPPPPPEPVAPAPAPAASTFGDGNLLVKDAEQANELRRKGIGIMITGGVITLAGTITSIAFTVRGTEYEKLLLTTSEQYNVADCSSKVTIKPNSKCDQLGKEIARDNAAIDFDDRATRVAGAAIASGVIVTVIGGIIYRLGIKKLRSGEIARVRMQPMLSRGFSGLALTGRF